MITVIIPVYNLAPYLKGCLDSLIFQKNGDFEVILVDDGSTDNSEEICKNFVKSDSRFKYIFKNNGGVSSARNEGLKVAKGEWIVFVDGDDIVDEDYLTIPENIDTNKNVDVIEKSYLIKEEGSENLYNIIKKDSFIGNNRDFIKYYSKYILGNSAALWNKIIRREIIADTIFDESKVMGEDFLFFLNIIPRIRKYYLSPKGKYIYIRRNYSASKMIDADSKRRIRVLFENMESVKKITKNGGISELGFFLTHKMYIPYMIRLRKYLSCKDWLLIVQELIKYPFRDKSLIHSSERFELMVNPIKGLIKTILRK